MTAWSGLVAVGVSAKQAARAEPRRVLRTSMSLMLSGRKWSAISKIGVLVPGDRVQSFFVFSDRMIMMLQPTKEASHVEASAQRDS